LPDLFHEYFGHLAWMTLPRYNTVVERFSRKYLASHDEERLIISNVWWFTIEFGLVREAGKVRPFGAGLLSSPGEFQYSMERTDLHHPFTFAGAAKATARPYAFHEEYFILDGFEQLEEATKNW
jgi:phenylalanine-4-hydroxylase